jgi:lauroyl/myristoyl acyltransferase
MTAVAEALDPPELFEWFRKKRQAIGIDINPSTTHAGTVLLSTLKAGEVVGLLL